jgi:hypothetical protein
LAQKEALLAEKNKKIEQLEEQQEAAPAVTMDDADSAGESESPSPPAGWKARAQNFLETSPPAVESTVAAGQSPRSFFGVKSSASATPKGGAGRSRPRKDSAKAKAAKLDLEGQSSDAEEAAASKKPKLMYSLPPQWCDEVSFAFASSAVGAAFDHSVAAQQPPSPGAGRNSAAADLVFRKCPHEITKPTGAT